MLAPRAEALCPLLSQSTQAWSEAGDMCSRGRPESNRNKGDIMSGTNHKAGKLGCNKCGGQVQGHCQKTCSHANVSEAELAILCAKQAKEEEDRTRMMTNEDI